MSNRTIEEKHLGRSITVTAIPSRHDPNYWDSTIQIEGVVFPTPNGGTNAASTGGGHASETDALKAGLLLAKKLVEEKLGDSTHG
ncbi:hypothetical protein [Chromobacterium amazonense]|uniref:hypothetical protein n=1 Tax=Chromobacterium amazonense TaxID=1382803 RepID=UPI0031F6F580